jgi:hypothetical protein
MNCHGNMSKYVIKNNSRWWVTRSVARSVGLYTMMNTNMVDQYSHVTVIDGGFYSNATAPTL